MSDDNYEIEVEMGDEVGSGFSGTDQTTQQQHDDYQTLESQTTGDDDKGGAKPPQQDKKPRSKLKERVGELTRKYHDTNRELTQEREQRQREQEAFKQERTQFQQAQMDSARVVHSTLRASKMTLEQSLKWARNQGDTAAEEKIAEDLIDVRTRMGQLERAYPNIADGTPASAGAQPQQQQPAAAQQQPPAGQTTEQPAAQPKQQFTAAQQEWLDANEFIRGDDFKAYHGIIGHYDQLLRAMGKDPSKPEFFEELNKRLKQDLPQEVGSRLKLSTMDDFADLDDDGDDDDERDTAPPATPPAAKKPADGGMTDGGRQAPQTARRTQKVKLTAEDRAFCARNGIAEKDYALQKARSGGSDYTYIT